MRAKPNSARSTRSWWRPTPRCPPATARWPPTHGGAARRPRASRQRARRSSCRRTIPRKAAWSRSIPARDRQAKPMLLLAHIDVVEAKREDWTRDPFKLVEEDGYFYARGASRRQGRGRDLRRHAGPLPAGRLQAAPHDQAGADLRRGDRRRVQRRAVAGRESSRAHRRGVRAQRRRAAASWSRTASASRYRSRPARRPRRTSRLEVTNPGGHSSRPVQDNAIYHLAGALDADRQLRVPGPVQRRQPRLFHRDGEDQRRARRRSRTR